MSPADLARSNVHCPCRGVVKLAAGHLFVWHALQARWHLGLETRKAQNVIDVFDCVINLKGYSTFVFQNKIYVYRNSLKIPVHIEFFVLIFLFFHFKNYAYILKKDFLNLHIMIAPYYLISWTLKSKKIKNKLR